jgi:hypothetical protein
LIFRRLFFLRHPWPATDFWPSFLTAMGRLSRRKGDRPSSYAKVGMLILLMMTEDAALCAAWTDPEVLHPVEGFLVMPAPVYV